MTATKTRTAKPSPREYHPVSTYWRGRQYVGCGSCAARSWRTSSTDDVQRQYSPQRVGTECQVCGAVVTRTLDSSGYVHGTWARLDGLQQLLLAVEGDVDDV